MASSTSSSVIIRGGAILMVEPDMAGARAAIWGGDVIESWNERLIGVAVGGDSASSHGGISGTMVGVPEANNLVASGVASGDLKGGLVGLGTTVAEEGLCEIGVGDLSEALGEADLG